MRGQGLIRGPGSTDGGPPSWRRCRGEPWVMACGDWTVDCAAELSVDREMKFTPATLEM